MTPATTQDSQTLTAEERLREAATAVLKDWDARNAPDQERLKCLDGHEYWSPAASMVGSQHMHALRAALNQGQG